MGTRTVVSELSQAITLLALLPPIVQHEQALETLIAARPDRLLNSLAEVATVLADN